MVFTAPKFRNVLNATITSPLFQWKIQGLQRLIRDSQEEYNMRKSKLLDIMDSQIGSGWKAKSGAVSNPKSLFQTGQGKVIFFNPGYEVSDAERIDPPNIPESLFAMQESFDADIQGSLDIVTGKQIGRAHV